MKRAKIISAVFLVLLFLFHGWLMLSDKTFFYKAVWYNFVGIDDYVLFANRKIGKSSNPQKWKEHSQKNKPQLSKRLQKQLDSLGTIAFLVIKNDAIVHEYYWDGYHEKSLSNSFSMAKSFVGTLVGIALQEGDIKSLDQLVSDFIPEFKEKGRSEITIRHLLMMSSGLKWDEAYANPFSATTEAYYGEDLYNQMLRLESIEAPGKVYRYRSCDTQLLAFVLAKATGMPVAEYAEKKLWEPLGFERDALWSMDKDGGNEKAYCCINSSARDFAKLGKLYLDSGMANTGRILPLDFFVAATNPHQLPDGDAGYAPSDFYGLHWWIIPNYRNHKIVYARGILGQFLILIPDKDIIIVRLGTLRGKKVGKHFEEIFTMVDEALLNE